MSNDKPWFLTRDIQAGIDQFVADLRNTNLSVDDLFCEACGKLLRSTGCPDCSAEPIQQGLFDAPIRS
jgi:hypothetical protein